MSKASGLRVKVKEKEKANVRQNVAKVTYAKVSGICTLSLVQQVN